MGLNYTGKFNFLNNRYMGKLKLHWFTEKDLRHLEIGVVWDAVARYPRKEACLDAGPDRRARLLEPGTAFGGGLDSVVFT